jgi:hypothetical protein
MARGFNPVVVHGGDKVVHHNSRWYRGIFLPFFLPCSSLLLLARAGAHNVLENEGTETNDAYTFHSMVVCIYT